MQQLAVQHNYVIPVVRISRLAVVHGLFFLQPYRQSLHIIFWWRIHFRVLKKYVWILGVFRLKEEWILSAHYVWEFHNQSVFAVWVYSLQTADVPSHVHVHTNCMSFPVCAFVWQLTLLTGRSDQRQPCIEKVQGAELVGVSLPVPGSPVWGADTWVWRFRHQTHFSLKLIHFQLVWTQWTSPQFAPPTVTLWFL